MAKTGATVEVTVGLSSCGIAAGAADVFSAFQREFKEKGVDARLRRTGCVGMCYREPIVDVVTRGGAKYTYGGLTADQVGRVVEEHVVGGKPVDDWLVRAEGRELPDETYYDQQVRLVLRNAGVIDPESIDEYIEVGGYEALTKVIKQMSQDSSVGPCIRN